MKKSKYYDITHNALTNLSILQLIEIYVNKHKFCENSALRKRIYLSEIALNSFEYICELFHNKSKYFC